MWGWTLAAYQKHRILKQPKLSASYKENVAGIFQSVNVTFWTWKSESIVGTSYPLHCPPLPFIKAGVEFSNFTSE